MASVTKTTTRNGSIRYRVRYRDAEARSREKWFVRKGDASRFAAQVDADLARGEWLDPAMTKTMLSEWAEEWFRTKAHRKPWTVAGYRSLLDCHVLPAFGFFELRRIQPVMIGQWIADLKAKGLSSSRTRQAFQVLNACLESAVDNDRLRKNPARVARNSLPPQGHREMRFLTHEQVELLAEAVEEPWRTLAYTLAYSGIRYGEVAALRRRRCLILKAQIVIEEAMSEVGGAIYFGEPKSKKSIRTVDVPRFLAEMLGRHIGDFVLDDPDALVFTSPKGGPLRHSNFYTRVWRPAVVRAGLPEGLRIHDLRHTSAAFMINEGANIELVRQQLGHSSIAVTNKYAHLYPRQSVQLADRLNARRESVREEVVGLARGRAGIAPATGIPR